MTQDLTNKTALVTASSRGIGRAIAKRFAASGALVGINYATNAAAAHETVKSIESEGGKAFVVPGRLGTPETARAVAAALQAELTKRTGSPGLDILVNNAGGVGGGGEATFVETTPEIYQITFADNVGSAFFLTQTLLPHLRTGGRVINVSSAGARLALQQEFVYCMAKGAVEVFTRALAKDLGPRGITVNCVSPGLIGTEAAVDYMKNPDALNYMKSNTALGRAYGEPEEIAAVVHDLAKPSSSWVTGQIIEVSGGFRI